MPAQEFCFGISEDICKTIGISANISQTFGVSVGTIILTKFTLSKTKIVKFNGTRDRMLSTPTPEEVRNVIGKGGIKNRDEQFTYKGNVADSNSIQQFCSTHNATVERIREGNRHIYYTSYH